MNTIIARRKLSLFMVIAMLVVSFAGFSHPSMADEYMEIGASILEESTTYTMADLNDMSYGQLIDIVMSLEWFEITDLFIYNDDAYEFYNDSGRRQALIDAIADEGRAYDGYDSLGLVTLIEVTRAGYYLASKNDDLAYLDSPEEHGKCQVAIRELMQNRNFNLDTSSNAELVEVTGKFINNTSGTPDMANDFIPILEDYNYNFDEYASSDTGVNRTRSDAVDKVVNAMLVSAKLTVDDDPEASEWFGVIDRFIDEIDEMIIQDHVTEESSYMIETAIYYTSQFSQFRTDPLLSNKVLTEAIYHYDEFSIPYLKAADNIDYYFNSTDYYGYDIEYEDILEDGISYYLPNTYTFDDGKTIIKTGEDVTVEKVKRLYWSMSEVQSQFFRAYGTDAPRDENHPDDVLQMHIYNNKSEYKANYVLFGYPTDNGGYYVEKVGSFYTYERTPEESRYTLEELFRHEYTHFLQGRYLVKGFYGNEEIYDGYEFDWYSEGGAEFFAGGTRLDGVVDRLSMIKDIDGYDEADWPTLSEMLSFSNYDDEIYVFGFAFMSYMLNERLDVFDNFADYILNDDADGYWDYIDEVKEDRDLNDGYMDHIKDLQMELDRAINPEVSDDYVAYHQPRALSEIQYDIESVADLTQVEVDALKSDLVNAYTLRGVYTGSRSMGENHDKDRMNDIVSGYLEDLSDLNWSGYDTVNCYYANHRTDASGNMQFDVVFKGILTDTVQNLPPQAVIVVPANCLLNEPVKFYGSDSVDPDGSIVEYDWYFSDGTTSDSENPTHTFTSEGDYEIELTVRDQDGAIDTARASIRVTEFPVPITEEYGKNGDPENANVGVCDGLTISGTLNPEENDVSDYFKFEVIEAGNLEIVVESTESVDLDWMLYEEDDLYDFVQFSQRDGDILSNTYDAATGVYYLEVSNYGNNNASYTLTVYGGIPKNTGENPGPGPDPTDVQYEVESNDNFDQAQGPIELDVTLLGEISNDDYRDIFYFEVDEYCSLDIVLKDLDNTDVYWLLFEESNTAEFVEYPDSRLDHVSGTYDADPGTYYIKVYNYTDFEGRYELIINQN